LIHASCNLNAAIVEGILAAHTQGTAESIVHQFSHGNGGAGRLKGELFLPIGTEPELLEVAKSNPALVMQCHYALWDRCATLLDRDEQPGFMRIDIATFCDDLGIARDKQGGGHKISRKHQVMLALSFLTRLRIRAVYLPHGEKQNHTYLGTAWHDGGQWRKGVPVMDAATGEAPEGPHGLWFDRVPRDVCPWTGEVVVWEPLRFDIAPCGLFMDPVWRDENRYLGLVARGMMEMTAGDRDKLSILLAGWLAAKAPSSDYQPRCYRRDTLESILGLSAAYPRHPTRRWAKLCTALNNVGQFGVIDSWTPEGEGDIHVRIVWPRELAKVGKERPTVRLDQTRQLRFGL
jgi:hypothetical protein